MIAAGRFRHRITIQRQEQAQDATTGAINVFWVDVAVNVAAAIEPLSAREYLAAETKQNEVVARIVIRFRSDIDGSMRIVHGQNIYNIRGLLPDMDSGIEYLTMPVSRGVNDGQ